MTIACVLSGIAGAAFGAIGVAAHRVMGRILEPVNRTPPGGRDPELGRNPAGDAAALFTGLKPAPPVRRELRNIPFSGDGLADAIRRMQEGERP